MHSARFGTEGCGPHDHLVQECRVQGFGFKEPEGFRVSGSELKSSQGSFNSEIIQGFGCTVFGCRILRGSGVECSLLEIGR